MIMEETRGQKLRRMRKERNLTIEEVATAIGVSKGFMSLLEKDKSGIRASRALELAKLFGVDVKEIIDMDIPEVVGAEPKWVCYLKEKFHPAQYVLDICKNMVKNAGLPECSALETDEEFEHRWDFFYQSILRLCQV
jgi:transcriptional regulator with XRE-family HTH domain